MIERDAYGSGSVAQCIYLLPATQTTYMCTDLSPSCLLLVELTTNGHGKAAKDGPNTVVPATHIAELGGVPGLWIQCGHLQSKFVYGRFLSVSVSLSVSPPPLVNSIFCINK